MKISVRHLSLIALLSIDCQNHVDQGHI